MRAWAAGLGLLLIGGCADSDVLDQAFGPDGQTLRQWIATAPPEQQEAFALAERRCTRCHTLNVPLSAHLAAGTWSLQVRKMTRKPGAGIPDADAQRIAAFLEYLESRRNPAPERR